MPSSRWSAHTHATHASQRHAELLARSNCTLPHTRHTLSAIDVIEIGARVLERTLAHLAKVSTRSATGRAHDRGLADLGLETQPLITTNQRSSLCHWSSLLYSLTDQSIDPSRDATPRIERETGRRRRTIGIGIGLLELARKVLLVPLAALILSERHALHTRQPIQQERYQTRYQTRYQQQAARSFRTSPSSISSSAIVPTPHTTHTLHSTRYLATPPPAATKLPNPKPREPNKRAKRGRAREQEQQRCDQRNGELVLVSPGYNHRLLVTVSSLLFSAASRLLASLARPLSLRSTLASVFSIEPALSPHSLTLLVERLIQDR